MDIRLEGRLIGTGQPCFIVAEVGLAHDGSLREAHAYIDACAAAGADGVKFQCHTGDQTSEWRVEPKWVTETRQDYWVRTGFDAEEWSGLAEHCRAVPVEFLCSPFSLAAARLIDPLVRLWKVPSGQVTNAPLLEYIARTKKPVLLSTGLGTEEEIGGALRRLLGSEVGLMQCTSLYPCPPSLLGIQRIVDYGGFSDHSGTIYPGIAAAALGCEVLEVHVAFSRESSCFDCPASITISDLRQLVRGLRFVEAAMRPVDKTEIAGRLAEHRKIFMGAA